jgi:hypothetical protein
LNKELMFGYTNNIKNERRESHGWALFTIYRRKYSFGNDLSFREQAVITAEINCEGSK